MKDEKFLEEIQDVADFSAHLMETEVLEEEVMALRWFFDDEPDPSKFSLDALKPERRAKLERLLRRVAVRHQLAANMGLIAMEMEERRNGHGK